jgi:cell division inhibitor SepF
MGFLDSLKEKIIGENVEDVDDGLYPIDEDMDGDGEGLDATNPGTTGESLGGAIELKVVKPERYGNVKQIADHLLNHRTVVLNLESTNKETAKRLLDFLSGVAYSIDGQLKRVATNTFVITPSNVDVSGEQMRTAAGEDTSNYTTTFGVAAEAQGNSETLFD